MKTFKLLLLTVLATVLFSPTFAEGDTKLGGVRAGYQMSDIYNSGVNGNPNSSFYIGVYKNNKIIPTLHWMVGLEYFQNGYNKNSDNKRIFQTVSLPLTVKLKVGPVFALGGFAANLKISEDYIKNGVDQGKQGADMDVPLIFGAGFRILILNIEARYHWGMIDVDGSGGNNQYLQLGLGVSF